MRKISLMLLCALLFSCDKDDNYTDLTFSSCNLGAENKTEVLTNLYGTITYTNKISTSELSTYAFVIRTEGKLPLQVCNMPSSFQLKENESKAILFSGNAVVYSDRTDAISAPIELTRLKFIK